MATLLTLPIYLAGFFAIGAWLGWPLAVLALSVPTVILCRHYGAPISETVTLLVVLSLLSALMLPAVPLRNPSPRRGACMNNLSVIGRAILQYEAACGSFPPPCTIDESGQPLASWRTYILPYLDGNDIYSRYQFDEPWNSPYNRQLSKLHLTVFQCPADPSLPLPQTSYLAVVGPGTVWSTDEPFSLDDIDDPSNTILLVEVTGSGVSWAEPRDLTLAEALKGINSGLGRGISSNHPGGVNVVFADGHMDFLSDTMTLEELRGLLTFESVGHVETEEADDD